MSNWRPTAYTVKHLRRAALQRFTLRSREMRVNADRSGVDDPTAWRVRHTRLLKWATDHCGPNGYTTDTRAWGEILWFCFEKPEHVEAFNAFFDTPESDQRVCAMSPRFKLTH